MRRIASLATALFACATAAASAPDAFLPEDGAADSPSVEVTPIRPPTQLAGFRLDPELRSLKYALFFTPGSAKLGPKAKLTVGRLAAEAKVAQQVVVGGRADPSGSQVANAALSLRRAQAVASALRAAGATRPEYVVVGSMGPALDGVAPDVHTLWRPNTVNALMRRADIAIHTLVDDEVEQPTPLALQMDAGVRR